MWRWLDELMLVFMINVSHLSKSYGNFHAVDDVSFTCESGTVTGFLGPNGAGKSTTMRMMVGLTDPDSGTTTFGGHRYVDLPNPGRHVGLLLDASAQHAGRSGHETLLLASMVLGLPENRVDEMLDLVGLTESEAKRRVGDYSLGMRQRLGLAVALLADPEMLVLDEPANGLDPAGIRWMRDLLRSYAARGGTVLLSSHLLNEVEQVADHLVMIGNGQIVVDGDQRSILGAAAQTDTLIRTTTPERLLAACAFADLPVEQAGDEWRVKAAPLQVGEMISQGGIVVTGLRSDGTTLEDLFLELTAPTQRGPVMAMAAPSGVPFG